MEREIIPEKDMLNLDENLFIIDTVNGACLKMKINGIEVSMACATDYIDKIYDNCEVRLYDIVTNEDITKDVLKNEKPMDITKGSELFEILYMCRNYKM
jgi:hypothetical protein